MINRYTAPLPLGDGAHYLFDPTRHELRVDGEVDTKNAVDLSTAIAESLRRCDGEFVLDLARLSFIDSSGVEVLIETRRHCDDAGISFVLANPSRAVSRIIGILELQSFFDLA